MRHFVFFLVLVFLNVYVLKYHKSCVRMLLGYLAVNKRLKEDMNDVCVV